MARERNGNVMSQQSKQVTHKDDDDVAKRVGGGVGERGAGAGACRNVLHKSHSTAKIYITQQIQLHKHIYTCICECIYSHVHMCSIWRGLAL